MPARMSLAIVFLLLIGLPVTPVFGQSNKDTDCPSEPLDPSDFAVEELIACVNELRNEVRIPRGTVMAYYTDARVDDTDNHCPSGWSPLNEARGRMIIGAGVPISPGFDEWTPAGETEGVRLTAREPLEPGGEERHKLSPDEMPGHNHGLLSRLDLGNLGRPGSPDDHSRDVAIAGYYGGLYPRDYAEGNNESHNNLPPYLSLYFCRKV